MDVKVSRKEKRMQQKGPVEVLVSDVFDFYPIYGEGETYHDPNTEDSDPDIRNAVFPAYSSIVSRVPLTDMPSMPDRTAGTAYKQVAWATTDGWAAPGWVTGEPAPAVTSSGLTTTIGTVYTSIIFQKSSTSYTASAIRYIHIRWSASTKPTLIKFYFSTSASAMGESTKYYFAPPSASDLWVIDTLANALWAGTVTSVRVDFVFASIDGQSASISEIYMGDGTYSSTVQDTVRYLPMSVEGVAKVLGPFGLPALDTTYGRIYGSDSGMVDGRSVRSIVFWFNTKSASTTQETVGSYGTYSGSGKAVAMYRISGGFYLDFYYMTCVGFYESPYIDGKWHSVAYVIEDGYTSVYVDAAPVGKVATPQYGTVLNGNYTVGGISGTGFKGKIVPPQFFNVALTQEQIHSMLGYTDHSNMVEDIEIIDDDKEELLDRAMFATVKQRGADPTDTTDGIQWAEAVLGEKSVPVIITQVQAAVQAEGPGVNVEFGVTTAADGKQYFQYGLTLVSST